MEAEPVHMCCKLFIYLQLAYLFVLKSYTHEVILNNKVFDNVVNLLDQEQRNKFRLQGSVS